MRKLIIVFCLVMLSIMPVSAENSGVNIVVSSVTTADSEATVSIKITENSGLAALKLKLDFDDSLELLSAEDKGLLPAAMFSNSLAADPFVLSWNMNSTADKDYTAIGELAELKFKLPEGAKGEYHISLSCDEGDAFNSKLQTLDVNISNGSISVQNSGSTSSVLDNQSIISSNISSNSSVAESSDKVVLNSSSVPAVSSDSVSSEQSASIEETNVDNWWLHVALLGAIIIAVVVFVLLYFARLRNKKE